MTSASGGRMTGVRSLVAAATLAAVLASTASADYDAGVAAFTAGD